MNWLTLLVPLEHEHARPLVVGRIIFHNHSCGKSGQNILDEKTVFRQFIIPMIRNLNLLTSSQLSNSLKRLTHLRSSIAET